MTDYIYLLFWFGQAGALTALLCVFVIGVVYRHEALFADVILPAKSGAMASVRLVGVLDPAHYIQGPAKIPTQNHSGVAVHNLALVTNATKVARRRFAWAEYLQVWDRVGIFAFIRSPHWQAFRPLYPTADFDDHGWRTTDIRYVKVSEHRHILLKEWLGWHFIYKPLDPHVPYNKFWPELQQKSSVRYAPLPVRRDPENHSEGRYDDCGKRGDSAAMSVRKGSDAEDISANEDFVGGLLFFWGWDLRLFS